MPRVETRKALFLLVFLGWPSLRCRALELGDLSKREPVEVAVVMSFDRPYSPRVLDTMEHELGSIMIPGYLQLNWRILTKDDATGVFDRIVVAQFKGNCKVTTDLVPSSGPLAYTHISDGEILPFVEVYCDRVRDTIRREFWPESVARDQLLFGRALARVLAHEMYHILANTTQHRTSGVAKCPLSARELVALPLRFDDSAQQLMKKNLGTRPAD